MFTRAFSSSIAFRFCVYTLAKSPPRELKVSECSNVDRFALFSR
jgi:hypothetical protein